MDMEEMLKSVLGIDKIHKVDLTGKSEIAKKVTDVLGDDVRGIICTKCEKCREEYAAVMATLCMLLDEGKIMLRKEDKNDDSNAS